MRRLLVPVFLASVGASMGMAGGCDSQKAKPAHSPGDLRQVVAKIGDQTITLGDLQEQINRLPPYARARYSSIERKKELLENLVGFEVMAKEAQERGYDKDPLVLRAQKEQMIKALLERELDAKLKPEDVPDAEVERYYKDHASEFNNPEQVRVSQIFTTDRATAQKAAALAKALPKGDANGFRELVTKLSEDEDSKPRGGDLTFFDRDTTMYPKALVTAAFAMKEINDVSDPIQTDKGWHVLTLTQRRPGFSRPLAEVKRQIQTRLFHEKRTKKMEEMIAQMRQRRKVEIYEDKLSAVVVDPAAAGASGTQPIPPPGAAQGTGRIQP